eukprot:TRINITY_DN71296_c0_g1_i1.p5 TRINITY_DN71296_c0_g1~~TRINITY_DN71296_c0_g1_i1.p5  ORF type:complete len:101 (-),score=0.86 TRINITY_DN71296_c0_g1_i1:19-321(-)
MSVADVCVRACACGDADTTLSVFVPHLAPSQHCPATKRQMKCATANPGTGHRQRGAITGRPSLSLHWRSHSTALLSPTAMSSVFSTLWPGSETVSHALRE